MEFGMKLVAFFMAIITPLIGLFYKPKTAVYRYTDNQIIDKEEKAMTEYEFGANDIAVSVSGSDENDGSEAYPVATVQRAKELAKQKNGEIRIWISGGIYYFTESMKFTSDDAENISFIAKPGEEVIFDGSMKIGGWQQDRANGHDCFSATVPDGLHFNAVFQGKNVLPQTRYPEEGYFYIEDENHENAKFTEENTPWSLTVGDMEMTPSSKQEIKAFKNPEDVTIRVLHLWIDDFSKLRGYDESRNRILLESPMSGSIEKNNKYFFENVYEAFDAPGEWYYDRTEGKIFYLPLAGQTKNNIDISIALTDKFVEICNCSGVSFEGITFRNTDSTYPEIVPNSHWLANSGIRHPQAEFDTGAAFEISDSENISIRFCNFNNIGLSAVKLLRRVKNSEIRGCNFTDIGASAVFIDGYNSDIDSEITENISFVDNRVNGYGRYFYAAIGAFLTHARNCDISNNEICNGYYSSISIGWIWGYTYSVTNHISVKNNYLHDIGQGWLSDMGGIYTLGNQPGTVLSGNVIRNVAADPGAGGYGGWGIYLDEGSQHILVEKNLVYDCGSQGFHQHYGENNMIRNNIFALNGEGQMCSSFAHGQSQIGYLQYEDESAHNEFTFLNNILLSDNTPVYAKAENRFFKDDSNICWDISNGKFVFNDYYSSNKPLDRIYAKDMNKLGLFNNAIITDPGFRDPANFDFTLPDDNAELNGSGFEKWNYNIAGTLTDHN